MGTEITDVVGRLRDISGWEGDHGDVGLCQEAADEIERLRDFRDCWRSLRSVLDSQIKHLEGEVARLTLTDAERGAIERGYCSLMGVEDMSAECTRWDAEAAATLRGLLERMQ